MPWTPPERPSELTENRLITAILNGTFPPGTNLPGERDLAIQLGITRPTLRTVLQRLGRDGWVEIRQGKPTRVRNYWEEGNLAVLVAVAMHASSVPADFVQNLLSVRILMSPAYGRLAVERRPHEVLQALRGLESLNDSAGEYAVFDWKLHQKLTILSGNPVFTLFINSVQGLYEVVGEAYYCHPETRAHSLGFYKSLAECARQKDGEAAQALIERIMRESSELWQTHFKNSNSAKD